MNAIARPILLLFLLFAVVTSIPSPAVAQAHPAPAAELAAGTLMFADDGVVREGFVGGTVRFHVLPRVSVGPEVAYIWGARHRHQMLTGNVTFDLVPAPGSERRTVVPFAVVGGGLFRTSEEFPGGTFASSEGAFTAGGGLRVRAGRRVIVGAEARVGWELHVRLDGFVGVRLGHANH
jgi:hypothetical protein